MNELFPILSESHLSWYADLIAVEVVGLLVDFSVFVDGGIGETATSYVVEISCELRLAIVISNDAEQLSFKKGTTFVRKTMIY